ncbi:unnamed protein product [Pleuronectes platessa]|uniref:Uncharacterized protein n=1 Tax=Pleuronectes platessa TaxID=8262 RepID=A0A9N7Z4M7_PLEPL|nr:unnamed protein product [Pleuronectes platessa]
MAKCGDIAVLPGAGESERSIFLGVSSTQHALLLPGVTRYNVDPICLPAEGLMKAQGHLVQTADIHQRSSMSNAADGGESSSGRRRGSGSCSLIASTHSKQVQLETVRGEVSEAYTCIRGSRQDPGPLSCWTPGFLPPCTAVHMLPTYIVFRLFSLFCCTLSDFVYWYMWICAKQLLQ